MIFFLGPKLIYSRKNADLTVAQMAKLLQIDKDEYHSWEMNKTEPPLEMIYKIAKSFDIPLEDFLNDDMDIVKFQVKYDVFHFANFRERRAYLQNEIENNYMAKRLNIDYFVKKAISYSEEKPPVFKF